MKTLILSLISSITFGQVHNISSYGPVKISGSTRSTIYVSVDTSKSSKHLATYDDVKSIRLPTSFDASVIKSGKIDTARLPLQTISFISETPLGIKDSTNRIFNTSFNPAGNIQLFINGLRSNDFTNIGNTMLLFNPPKITDVLIVDYFK